MFARLFAATAVFAAPALASSLDSRADAVIYAGAPISDIRVTSTSLTQCSQATISWTGAVDPITLYIAIGGFYVGEQPVETRSDVYGGSAQWLVNQKAGQSMHFRVTDAGGKVGYVQGLQIADGDGWCLDNGNGGGGASSAASATSASSEVVQSTWSDSSAVAATQSPQTTETAKSDADAAAPSSASSKKGNVSSRSPSASSSPTGASSGSQASGDDKSPSASPFPSSSSTGTGSISGTSASPSSSSSRAPSTSPSPQTSTSTSPDQVSAVGANAPRTSGNAAAAGTERGGWWSLAGALVLAVGVAA